MKGKLLTLGGWLVAIVLTVLCFLTDDEYAGEQARAKELSEKYSHLQLGNQRLSR